MHLAMSAESAGSLIYVCSLFGTVVIRMLSFDSGRKLPRKSLAN